ncbi:hypothetical protein SAMN04490204_1581 [Pseudomonas thivervalensis]|nr:hypothetical protein SAMN04490204_1581 [Pseudomonas thivervalensis]
MMIVIFWLNMMIVISVVKLNIGNTQVGPMRDNGGQCIDPLASFMAMHRTAGYL